MRALDPRPPPLVLLIQAGNGVADRIDYLARTGSAWRSTRSRLTTVPGIFPYSHSRKLGDGPEAAIHDY
jgi:hypothetical protein